jgi:hypothetical protein
VNEGIRVSMPNVPADMSTQTFMLQIAVSRQAMAKLKIKKLCKNNLTKMGPLVDSGPNLEERVIVSAEIKITCNILY